MRVAGLWRYPVKSLAGERLRVAAVDRRGVVGDRGWALVGPDGAIAAGKTTRRFRAVPGLLRHRSWLERDTPWIVFADGSVAWAGMPEQPGLADAVAPTGWTLRREGSTPHHDAGAIHLVTTATVAALGILCGQRFAVERLRPNILLRVDGSEPFPEDAWLDRVLVVGDVLLHVVARTTRCAMIEQAQTGVAVRRGLLRIVSRANDACAGVYADVVRPGRVALGDRARVV